MKRFISLLLTLILSVSMFATLSAGAVITNPADVGKVGDQVSVIDGINNDNLNEVRKLIIKEYKRGIQTRSVKHRGKAYFDYGNSTGEYVHAWVGSMQKDQQGQPFYNAAMNQDFSGGFSDSLATLGQGDNWCCILVTMKSLAKGEAYTVRDGIANKWGNAGGTNSEWGMPTDNQRWVQGDYGAGSGWYCYQVFDWGYALGLNGSTAFVDFYRFDEGNTPPSGGSYDNTWGEPEPAEKPIEFDIPFVEVFPALNISWPTEQKTEDPSSTPDGEPVSDTSDGNSQDGEQSRDDNGNVITADEDGNSANASKNSSKVSSGSTITGYTIAGLTVGSPQFIAAVCGLVAVVAAIVIVIIVVVRKKKKAAAADDETVTTEETPADNGDDNETQDK